MDTWNMFTTGDLILGLVGAAGFLSVIIVIMTASSRVNKREVILSQARRLQNLEPDENVIPENYYGDGDHYETSGK